MKSQVYSGVDCWLWEWVLRLLVIGGGECGLGRCKCLWQMVLRVEFVVWWDTFLARRVMFHGLHERNAVVFEVHLD